MSNKNFLDWDPDKKSPNEVEIDIMPNKTFCVFVAVQGNDWGKGRTPQMALKNMRKIHGSMSLDRVSMAVVIDSKDTYEDVYVNDMGGVCYLNSSTRIDFSSDGTAVVIVD